MIHSLPAPHTFRDFLPSHTRPSADNRQVAPGDLVMVAVSGRNKRSGVSGWHRVRVECVSSGQIQGVVEQAWQYTRDLLDDGHIIQFHARQIQRFCAFNDMRLHGSVQ